MKSKIILTKSYQFSLNIIDAFRKLKTNNCPYQLSNQLLRSGTSIGANIEEGIAGYSKRDFIYKFQISYKEAKECHYWIRLLKDSNLMDTKGANDLLNDCGELIKILYTILKSSKESPS